MRRSRIAGQLGVGLSWGVALLLGTGCEEGESPAGAEQAALDLGSCLATDCTATEEGSVAEEPDFEACDEETAGTLQDELVFSSTRSAAAPDQIRVAPDGSLWVLSGARAYAAVVVKHYSDQGRLLGETPSLAPIYAETSFELSDDITIAESGHAFVTLYAVMAPAAGGKLDDFLALHELDSDAAPVRAPLTMKGIAQSQVVAGADGSVILAGDAFVPGPTTPAPHGIVARIDAGNADWIQTGVPSSAAAAGVTALAQLDGGVTAVLSQRAAVARAGGLFSGTYGVARFDEHGAWLDDVTLSTA